MVWFDSDFFGAPEIIENTPDDIDKINPVLTSPKFQKFLGRFRNEII
jgi:hypothetical protein